METDDKGAGETKRQWKKQRQGNELSTERRRRAKKGIYEYTRCPRRKDQYFRSLYRPL
jgi:hypothetical protein